MSAIADVIRRSEQAQTAAPDILKSQGELFPVPQDWNPKQFAAEQIRGLVRQVFFSTGAKHVVFSSAGTNPDIAGLCEKVGHALALETSADVAIVRCEPSKSELRVVRYAGSMAIKSWSVRVGTNLWCVPGFKVCDSRDVPGTAGFYLTRLAELRSEFEYAVIQGPAAGVSSDAALLGELTDGIILVLGANGSRRAIARKIKEHLEAARARILGTVLSERRFPIPEGIYRRL
jgi:hypothetical protein